MIEYYAKNREKIRSYQNEYYKKNRHKSYEKALIKKYGITLDDYNMMYESQGGVCKICEQKCDHPQRNDIDTLCVDHCHETGKVRGLLCNKCNSLLGWARDNIETLAKAIDYLNETSTSK